MLLLRLTCLKVQFTRALKVSPRLILFQAILTLLCLPVVAASSVNLSTFPSPSLFGAPVTLTATITPGSATGRVTFYDGTTVLGIRTISGGTASLTSSLLPGGNRSLRVYYAGDASNA